MSTFSQRIFSRIKLGLANIMSIVEFMLMLRWNACEIWSIQMMSESDPFSCLSWHFSLIVLSEIFNPYPFILGIEQPNAKLFGCIIEDMISQRNILVPWYSEGFEGVTTLLSKAAPSTNLYFYI
jgi:hypothetical protein